MDVTSIWSQIGTLLMQIDGQNLGINERLRQLIIRSRLNDESDRRYKKLISRPRDK